MCSMREFLKRLVSDDKTNTHKIMNIFMLVGMLVGIITFIITAIIAPTLYSLLCIGIIILLTLIILFVANVLKKPIFAGIILNLILNLVLLPFLFFTSGGIDSGCVLWMLIGLILTFAVIPGTKLTLIIYSIDILGPIATLIISYLHPELVVKLDSDLSVIIDVISSIIFVSVIFGAVYKYQAFFYEKQQKKLNDANSVANAATTAKTNFLSNMTHDIRTPMNAIIGYTEIARKNADNRVTLLSSLSNISTASEHLLSLVNDVLDMSRIESGKFELENEPASITEIIEKVEAIMKPEMEDIDIHFIVDTSAVEDDSISCDVLRLTQILINVLSNAVKYSHPGGHVYVTVNQRQNPAIETIMCEIRIRDEGIGMGADFIPHVFEPFTREKTTTVTGIPGSGLGLSITKTLVEMMKGSISVKSEVGKGSEFIIRIPFEVPTLLEFDSETIIKQYNFTGKRVLVVEDNELNTEIAKEILMDVGFEVDIAQDGTYAVEKVRISTPGYYDVILMDVQMPLMNGYEATEIIRSFENEEIANVPIIALTANAFEADKEKAVTAGMNDFVVKPINSVELMETISRVIKK